MSGRVGVRRGARLGAETFLLHLFGL
jgi:hypothetical protein